MKDKYRDQWEGLGASDPYWAVLSDPDKRGCKWDSTEFFNTGKREIENTLSKVTQAGERIYNEGTALDFGCGVGRLSRGLAVAFRKVIAVDISTSMISEAKRVNSDSTNIHFIHNAAEDLSIVPDESIDFLYSNIVLQHMPRNRQLKYIKEFCRVLTIGGILAFQTPSKCNLKSWKGILYYIFGNKVLNIVRKAKYGSTGVMELHTLPRQTILETLNQHAMNIFKVERNNSVGTAFYSYMYYAKKEGKTKNTNILS